MQHVPLCVSLPYLGMRNPEDLQEMNEVGCTWRALVIPFFNHIRQRRSDQTRKALYWGHGWINPRTHDGLLSLRLGHSGAQSPKCLKIQTSDGFCIKIFHPLSPHHFLALLPLPSIAFILSESLFTSLRHSRKVLTYFFAMFINLINAFPWGTLSFQTFHLTWGAQLIHLYTQFKFTYLYIFNKYLFFHELH